MALIQIEGIPVSVPLLSVLVHSWIHSHWIPMVCWLGNQNCWLLRTQTSFNSKLLAMQGHLLSCSSFTFGVSLDIVARFKMLWNKSYPYSETCLNLLPCWSITLVYREKDPPVVLTHSVDSLRLKNSLRLYSKSWLVWKAVCKIQAINATCRCSSLKIPGLALPSKGSLRNSIKFVSW